MKKNKKINLPRLLILGCGDIGTRLLPLLRHRFRIFAVTQHNRYAQALRDAGAIPVMANLDDRDSLSRVTHLAPTIIHLTPPQPNGLLDQRTRHLIGILPKRATLVYVSTTGVYGDCQGDLFDETRPIKPKNERAHRRADAEHTLRTWAKHTQSRLSILRVPGIYAENRLPIERLKKNSPVLKNDEDVYTNHIHADDLAQIIVAALYRARPNRVYHAVDQSALKMGDYLDLIADDQHLSRPPRLSRVELERQCHPLTYSFMSESRRLKNTRLQQELGVRLQYPCMTDFLNLHSISH